MCTVLELCHTVGAHEFFRFGILLNAVEFMHSLDPQVIHGDIRGVRYRNCSVYQHTDQRFLVVQYSCH